MKIRPNAFKAASMYAYIDKLAIDFDVPLINDITLKIPTDKGYGYIKNIFFEDDFCIRYYHFSLKKNTPFTWFYNTESDEPLYKLMFTCANIPLMDEDKANIDEPQCVVENTTVLYSPDFDAGETIPANTWVTKIALIFTKEWLEENFLDASYKITDSVMLLKATHKPSYLVELMDHSYYAIVNEIIKEMDRDIFPVIHIKTKSLVLLNTFLNKVVATNEHKDAGQKSLYYDTIVAVEQRLNKYLLTTMPSIAQLSSDFNMSPSTLQRHFKIVFGKNIYQYYLEQKLAIGKEMITSKKKTISEVAYLLGYHKINSFSRVFKKYFGMLPKDINSIKVK